MINSYEYVFKLYPEVVVIREGVAYDKDDNIVDYDMSLVQAEIDATAYIAKRAAEYPPVTDYLDAVVKGDTAQQQAYIDACLAVKAKYPKGVA